MDVPHDSTDRAPAALSVESFGDLFEEHYDRIWRYLFRLGGRDCADDLAGEVFVQALVGRDRFDPSRAAVGSWLYGIASNLARSWHRRRARGRRATLRLVGRAGEMTDLESVADDLDDRDSVSRVAGALPQLAVGDREILVLAVWEELSYAQIAEILDVPIGTVRSRLSRARTRLRELAGLPDQVPDV